ncbi:SWIM zinc finger family protein [Halorarius litoreus]|uniref:SWIM zinc finger family protein n=1 Tax=Halorarius litoreus TaxID=2962676 RepID=UPI0020CF97C2|nr:SWIM zinc finger family protein [Halorarius litoreus]
MTHLEHTPASPPRKKRPLAPDIRRLDDRSARAWTESMAVTPLGRGRYAVDAGDRYVVNLPEHRCSCPDASIRGETCKHLRRVAIEITRHEVPPPGKREGQCAACGHDRFVPEDGPDLCDDCRFVAGDIARDRETGDRVVVVESTDDPADEWVVEGTDTTIADYETNEGYPSDDPVVVVVYPFSRRFESFADLKRYAFPHSRLEPTEEQFVV